ncbi:hypothetical protein BGZ83_010827 [Gryganskiella cystojenkinii]|nr:hypothetical protein BGZ83_010827 [Gryganskiella cystojenkinii]
MTAANQQRICIGPQVKSQAPVSMLLPNPSSGLPSRYILQDEKLFEMQMVDSEGLRSWFVGDTIQSDGSLYIITPIDPVFMFIPILDIMRKKTPESEGRFLTVEGIFESDQYTSLRRLLDLARLPSFLELVCEAITQSSLRLVTSYLSDDWATKISSEYKFPELEKLESRTQLPSVADFGKRAAMEFEEDGKPTKDTKKSKMSVGQRKLAKASTAGMKPLSSFFVKK